MLLVIADWGGDIGFDKISFGIKGFSMIGTFDVLNLPMIDLLLCTGLSIRISVIRIGALCERRFWGLRVQAEKIPKPIRWRRMEKARAFLKIRLFVL